MVNSVSFAAKRGLYDRPNLDGPQAHQKPQETMVNHPRYEEPKKSSHKALKVIAGLVAAAAVVVGATALGSKMGWLKPDKIKNIIPNKLLNWDKVANFKQPIKTGLAAVEGFGTKVADGAVKGFNATVEFFKNLIPKKST